MAQWQTNVAGGARPIDWNNSGQSVPLILSLLLHGQPGEQPAQAFTDASTELLASRLADLLAAQQSKDDEVQRYERITSELAAARKTLELRGAERDELDAKRKAVALRAEPNYAAELQRIDKARNKAETAFSAAAATHNTLLAEQRAFADSAVRRRAAMEEDALKNVRRVLSDEQQALENRMPDLLAATLDRWLTLEFANRSSHVNRDQVLAAARQKLVQRTGTPAALVTPETLAPEPTLPPPPNPLHGQMKPAATGTPAALVTPETLATGTPPPIAPWQQRVLPRQDVPGCPPSAPVTADATPAPERVAATMNAAAATETAGP